ncbi:MAG: four helix bundle protein [bacterium]
MAIPTYKIEKLEVWQISLELNDFVYGLISVLPDNEKYNLSSQLQRAVTSISLNIAEGSTGTTDKEQANFLKFSRRSCMEIIGCTKISLRREYIREDQELTMNLLNTANKLFAKLNSFISYLKSEEKGNK